MMAQVTKGERPADEDGIPGGILAAEIGRDAEVPEEMEGNAEIVKRAQAEKESAEQNGAECYKAQSNEDSSTLTNQCERRSTGIA
jgi:hypothetical protein